mmetsp:Transcript_46806/g.100068  ORF Transcript_46806/g.100068 Transcript_46806/m.100068 type:complete len:388 (-) Transcript_46806:122-1285(-)
MPTPPHLTQTGLGDSPGTAGELSPHTPFSPTAGHYLPMGGYRTPIMGSSLTGVPAGPPMQPSTCITPPIHTAPPLTLAPMMGEAPQPVQMMERIVYVPKIEVVEVERRVPRPEIHFVEKIVEVPQPMPTVDRNVQAPTIQVQQGEQRMSRPESRERIVHVPGPVEIREQIQYVPKPEIHFVEKTVHVPKVQTVERIVEVPQVVQQELVRHVPKYETETVQLQSSAAIPTAFQSPLPRATIPGPVLPPEALGWPRSATTLPGPVLSPQVLVNSRPLSPSQVLVASRPRYSAPSSPLRRDDTQASHQRGEERQFYQFDVLDAPRYQPRGDSLSPSPPGGSAFPTLAPPTRFGPGATGRKDDMGGLGSGLSSGSYWRDSWARACKEDDSC